MANLEVTEKCNTKCLHCYNPWREENMGVNSFDIERIKKKLSNYRFTIDFKQDLSLLQKTIKLSKKGIDVKYTDIIDVLKKKPKLKKLNSNINKRFYIKRK